MDITRLLSDELSFELEVRGAASGKNVREKRELLRDCLRAEREGNTGNLLSGSIDDTHLPICQAKIEELSGRIQDFDMENKDSEYKGIKSRLLHVQARLLRIACGTGDAETLRDELLDKCKNLLSSLEDICITQRLLQNASTFEEFAHQSREQRVVTFRDPPQNNVSSPLRVDNIVSGPIFDQGNNQNTEFLSSSAQTGRQLLTAPQSHVDDAISQLSSVFSGMLSKLNEIGHHNVSSPTGSFKNLNLYFDGHNMSLSCFLERIEELRVSRGLTKDQLLKSAPEIFKNEVLN